LTVEAKKVWPAIEGRERAIPIESPSARRFGSSRSSSYSPRGYYDSGRGSANDYYRADSRAIGDNNYLAPKSNGYRTGYEQRKVSTKQRQILNSPIGIGCNYSTIGRGEDGNFFAPRFFTPHFIFYGQNTKRG
jgi:hypothetical protein